MTGQGTAGFSASQISLIRESVGRDPETGITYMQVFRGTPSALDAHAQALLATGATVENETVAGQNIGTLTARWARNPTAPTGAEAPTDRWGVSMDALQVDLFNHPQAKLEAQLWAGTTSGLSKYSKLIRDAVSNGDPFPAGSIPVATNPVALTIYNLLCNGTDYFELPRPVLSRSRSFSTSYPTRLVQNAAVTVYSRASLISTFSIPSSVQNQIPPTPATAPPTGEVWAWRLRRQDSTYEPSTRRYSEQMEWDLNSWSTLLYAYVP